MVMHQATSGRDGDGGDRCPASAGRIWHDRGRGRAVRGLLRGLRRARGARCGPDRAPEAAQGPSAGHRLHARHAGAGGRALGRPPAVPAAARRRARRRPLHARHVGRRLRLPRRAPARDRRPARPGGARGLHGAGQLRVRAERDVRAGRAGRVVGERGPVPVRLAERDRRRLPLLRLLRHDRAPVGVRRGRSRPGERPRPRRPRAGLGRATRRLPRRPRTSSA